MKKLLLFIILLFGILSMQSFAWNYGCGENIPPSVCGADGSGNSGYNNEPADYSKVPAVSKYLFRMFLNNEKYDLIDLKTTDTVSALNAMWASCSEKINTVCYIVDQVSYLAVVSSENGQIFYGGADPRFGVSKDRAESYAKNECKKAKGNKCKLVIMIEPNFKLVDKRANNTKYLKVTN